MTNDLLDCYTRASEWALDKVKGAANELDSDTPCDKWDVRELMNHMLETQRYFVGSARGEDASPPGQTPPSTLLGDDPVSAFKRARAKSRAGCSPRISGGVWPGGDASSPRPEAAKYCWVSSMWFSNVRTFHSSHGVVESS